METRAQQEVLSTAVAGVVAVAEVVHLKAQAVVVVAVAVVALVIRVIRVMPEAQVQMETQAQ
jgi:hypothetical protein